MNKLQVSTGILTSSFNEKSLLASTAVATILLFARPNTLTGLLFCSVVATTLTFVYNRRVLLSEDVVQSPKEE